MYACTDILPPSCISSLGPLGCYFKLMADQAQGGANGAAEEPMPSNRAPVLGPALGAALGGKSMSYDPALAGGGGSELVGVNTYACIGNAAVQRTAVPEWAPCTAAPLGWEIPFLVVSEP
jgi:hypothetical protein